LILLIHIRVIDLKLAKEGHHIISVDINLEVAKKTEPGRLPDPVFYQNLTNLLSGSGLAETIAAVDGLITAGLERDFGGFTALGTGGREHLAFTAESAAAAAITLGLPCLSAFGTALWLVGVAFGLEEFLVFSTERKGSAAIGTRKGFFLKTHWTTSSLKLLVSVLVIQHLREFRLRGS